MAEKSLLSIYRLYPPENVFKTPLNSPPSSIFCLVTPRNPNSTSQRPLPCNSTLDHLRFAMLRKGEPLHSHFLPPAGSASFFAKAVVSVSQGVLCVGPIRWLRIVRTYLQPASDA